MPRTGAFELALIRLDPGGWVAPADRHQRCHGRRDFESILFGKATFDPQLYSLTANPIFSPYFWRRSSLLELDTHSLRLQLGVYFNMDSAFLASAQEVLKQFQVIEKQGLSDKQVKDSTAKYGRNGKTYLFVHGTRLTRYCSSARRPSYTALGTCSRAVQGPACHNLAWICCRVICTSAF